MGKRHQEWALLEMQQRKGQLVALGPEKARRVGSWAHLRDTSFLQAEGRGKLPEAEVRCQYTENWERGTARRSYHECLFSARFTSAFLFLLQPWRQGCWEPLPSWGKEIGAKEICESHKTLVLFNEWHPPLPFGSLLQHMLCLQSINIYENALFPQSNWKLFVGEKYVSSSFAPSSPVTYM